MSETDLDRIEQSLSICLPQAYRSRVSPFPVQQESDNTDSQVWDDANRLIAFNRRLRAEVEGWPDWLFAIGQAEGDPCGYAIDTRTPEAPVWWLEQMQLGRYSGPGAGPFAQWFEQWVDDASG